MPNSIGSDITKAGDYIINKMVLRSGVDEKQVDIRAMYSSFEIYEDIFSPFMTAKIYMKDSLNLPELFRIRGQEIIEISFQSDVGGIEPTAKTFRVYKIDQQIIDENGRGQQYVLHLMSEGGYANYTESCGYSLKGKISDMIPEIFKKHFPEYLWKDTLSVQSTADNFVYVFPQSNNPFKSISWLAKRAICGIDGDYSPYLFYETIEGYKFHSLSKIIEDGQTNKDLYYFTKSNVNRNPETNEGTGFQVRAVSSFPEIYNRIQSLKEVSRFDMVDNFSSGIITSRLAVHDIVNKEIRKSAFKESDIFEKVKKIGTFPHRVESQNKETNELFTKNNASFSYLTIAPYTEYTEKNSIIDNYRFEEYFLKRRYMINTMMTQKLIIQIFGDSTKRVGQLMDIHVPKIASDGHIQDEKDDKNLSGEYMITSLSHQFGEKYGCLIELSRNAMGV